MNTAELLDGAADAAMADLDEAVREGQVFPPSVTLFRDHSPVATVVPPTMGTLWTVARLAAGGFNAEHLLIVTDAYEGLTPKGLSPLTGEMWAPGEMDHVANDHDGIAQGWVTEALSLLLLGRDGSQNGVLVPYTRTEDGVLWSGKFATTEDSGRWELPEGDEMWTAPPFPSHLPAEMGDTVTAAMLDTAHCAVALLVPIGDDE